MKKKDYQSILETLEILSDEKAVEELRQSISDVKEGRVIPWQQAKARLGI
jgi:PHD/YefM family antitoxin component YafN of YafNO toxin-antitoxin module